MIACYTNLSNIIYPSFNLPERLRLLQTGFFLSSFWLISTFIILFLGSCITQTDIASNDRRISFDTEWRFIKDDPAGAETMDFNDSGWSVINVPHDWSIEDLPGQNGKDIIGPFDKYAIDKGSTAYLVGGTGWYRKNFTIADEDKVKIAYLQFDGVCMRCDVWINGKYLGFHPYGYTPFGYNITSYLNPTGQPNLVAVRVSNEGMNSRWYTGSGIYRHVWLTLVNPVHIDVSGGLYITTPVITRNSADVKVVTSIVNSGHLAEIIAVHTRLSDPAGKVVTNITSSLSVLPGETNHVTQILPVKKPFLWSIVKPNLYEARVSVLIDNKIVDELASHFGIRSIKINAQNGFTINGKSVEMIGGCIHHDNGPLGVAAIDRAEERKIELLKSTGFNAIRTAHNPPSPALLDACDRHGMLVINEIFDVWETAKRNQDYHLYFPEWWQKDVESWVKRDRNHPSVIIWSIGNEVREVFDTSGLRIARNLTGEIRKLDQTRLITECFVDFAWMRGQKSKWDEIPEHMALFDLLGYNYAFARYEEDHIKYPDRVMIGTETNSPMALENYEKVRKLPYVIGYFVWTAMDNLGEAGVGLPKLIDIVPDNSQSQVLAEGFFNRESWPVFCNYQGDLDLIGNRKVPSYYQHVVWGKSKVEIFVHRPIPEGKREITSNWGFPDELKSWNWSGHDGEKLQVHVYTRSPQVILELNGKIIAKQTLNPEKSITATFVVPYEPGTLTAFCYDNGKLIASQTIETTGKPAALNLIADRTEIRADRNDLSYVRAEIVDSEGRIVPDADDIIVNFEVTGQGRIAAVGSGNPSDMSSFQRPRKKAYQGICLAIVQPETIRGKIKLRAFADGLKEASIEISAD